MDKKKVGIIIKSGLNIFSSGLIQNAYFINQTLTKVGMTCEFLTVDENPIPFHYKNLEVKKLGEVKEYCLLITVSTGLVKAEYELCVSNKVAVITFICGNQFMHDMESFVVGDPHGRNTFIAKGTYSDELWVIPCYKFALTYLETIRGKPAFIVPHLWSPIILEEMTAMANKSKDQLYYKMPQE
jgi:hypothetical protein